MYYCTYVRVSTLFSGGKDSTFSIYKAIENGHDVVCLTTMHPVQDDSLLFHYPNSWLTPYLAEAMQIPTIGFTIRGRSKEDEFNALDKAIGQVKSIYDIQGVVHGGIYSRFQKKIFEQICLKHELASLAPLWNVPLPDYLYDLIDNKFHIKIIGVSTMGLDKDWLGKSLDRDSIVVLERLSKKYGFNLAFEGGEAETLTIDCPLFKKKLDIRKANIRWDGQRGMFEILEAVLVPR